MESKFFFAQNFSIGVKWGEKKDVFGFTTISRDMAKNVEKMKKVTAFILEYV